MKKLFLVIIMLSIFLFTACGGEDGTVSFSGTITEIDGTTAIVEPYAMEDITNSADKISIDLSVSDDTFSIGDSVKVYYDGTVMESYPAQVNVLSIEKIEK